MATTNWNAPQNPQTTSPNDVANLLGTHSDSVCGEGTDYGSVTNVSGPLGVNDNVSPFVARNTVSLAGKTYATQFKTASSQTAIERVIIPLLQIGNGSDVVVSLYTDSSGSPGTQVGSSVTIPAKWCIQKSADQFPSYVIAMTGWEEDSQSQLPADLFRFGGAWNGSAVCVFGGASLTNQNGPAFSSVYIGKPTGPNGGLQWQTAVTLPSASEWMGYCYVPPSGSQSSGYVVYSGGGSAGSSPTISNAIYVATFDAEGNLGSWTLQTSTLPVSLWTHAMATYTSTAGVVYLYAIGGSSASPVSALTSVYMNTMSTYGAITAAWTATSSLPTGLAEISASCAVINGYIVVIGGGTSNIYYAKINDANGTLGPWITGPSLTVAMTDVCVCTQGDQLIFLGGVYSSNLQQEVGVATLSANGIWSHQIRYDNFVNSPIAASFAFITSPTIANSDFDLYAISINTGTGSDAHFVSGKIANLVSVPFKVTGLTSSTLYWIAIACANVDIQDYTQALYTISLTSSQAPAAGAPSLRGAHSAYPVTTWTADGNSGVPVQVMGTANGQRAVHNVQDGGAKIDWFLMDAHPRLAGRGHANNNTTAGNYSVVDLVACGYDPNGELVTVSSVA